MLCGILWFILIISWIYRNNALNEVNGDTPVSLFLIVLPFVGIVVAGFVFLVNTQRLSWGLIIITLLIAVLASPPCFLSYSVIFGWPAILINSCLIAGVLYQKLEPEVELHYLYWGLVVLSIVCCFSLTNNRVASRWAYATISDPVKAVRVSIRMEDEYTALATNPKIYAMSYQAATKPAVIYLDRLGPIYLYCLN